MAMIEGFALVNTFKMLMARIRALEARVETLEAEVGIGDKADTETACDYMAEHDGWNEPDGTGYPAALDEEDPDDFWIGGTDGPDD